MGSITLEVMSVGPLIRTWRQRRRLSQLELALDAGVSTRHLSFVETGRSRPSERMVIHLAEQLEVPLRERNQLLLAAGYAPAYPRRGLDEPELEPVRGALERVLEGHEPFPALVVDRQWEMVAAHRAAGLLLEGVAAHLLEPPVNALRVTLHPEGMAPRIRNLGEGPGAAAPPPRARRAGVRRPGAGRAPRGAARLPRAGRAGARARRLHPAAAGRPVVPEHAHDVRDGRRRDRLRAGRRGVLPRRRRHRRRASVEVLTGD